MAGNDMDGYASYKPIYLLTKYFAVFKFWENALLSLSSIMMIAAWDQHGWVWVWVYNFFVGTKSILSFWEMCESIYTLRMDGIATHIRICS